MSAETGTRAPLVTLVVPVRNEQVHIAACLKALMGQTYPAERLQIIVADGESDDSTAQIVTELAHQDARIHLIFNRDRSMAAGLNQGIAVARGDIIGVISGHSIVEHDYVSRVVHALTRKGAWSAGGAIMRVAQAPLQRAIAAATTSPVGVGDARHNYDREAGWVESVFPGAWPRWVFERIGVFDTAMPFNEDNEFSLRIRMAGGRIWYDPDIRVKYVPRGNLRDLFVQYHRYARGRVRVFRKHGSGLSWRHLTPAATLAWLVGGALVAPFSAPIAAGWLAGCVAYGLLILVAGLRARSEASAALVCAALVTLHAAYATGFLRGWVDALKSARLPTGPATQQP